MKLFRNTTVLLLVIILFNNTLLCQNWEFVSDTIPSMGRSICMSYDSCFVFTGTCNTFDPGFTTKTDWNGNVIWCTPYGGQSVKQTYDGGYIIARDGSGIDGYLYKLDSLGELLWAKNYGGLYQDNLSDVIQTHDSCFVACGYTKSFEDSTMYLIKTDSSGNLLWHRSFSTYETGSLESLIEVDSNYYVTGYHREDYNTYYLFAAKINQNGQTIWRRDYPNGSRGFVESIALTKDSALITVGSNIITKLSLDGDSIWSKAIDHCWEFYSVAVTPDNDYIISGTHSYGKSVDHNLVIKTDSMANMIWYKLYTNGSSDSPSTLVSIISTSNKGFITCGYAHYSGDIRLRVIKDTTCEVIEYIPDFFLTKKEVYAYPNPTKGKFYIDIEDFQLIEVINSSGNTIYKSEKNEIDITNFASGIYFFKVISGNRISYGKILKE